MTAANIAAKSASDIAAAQWAQTEKYLPEQMERARREDERSQRMADLAEDDAAYYRGISEHQFERSKLSEKYQDRMYGLADEYDSGKRGEEEAAMANADVEQAFGNATGSMVRNASRLGINVGSDGFAAGMSDMFRDKALAAASAQTMARRNARAKAESMVAMAAGAGQASFSNGMGVGGMGGNAGVSAAGLGAGGLQGYAGAMGTFNQGAASASSNQSQASSQLRANAIESAKNPGFDFLAGLATAGVKGLASPGM